MKEIKMIQWQENACKAIGKDWMLVTAQKDGVVNTMTASWGGLGIMWGKEVAYVFIRPQRYTKEFIDGSDTLSLSFYEEEYRDMLNYMGTVSGRDEDKIAKQNLTTVTEEAAPYFAEAKTVFICKKLYAQDMDGRFFLEEGLDEKWYAAGDYHRMYVCEITKVLVK